MAAELGGTRQRSRTRADAGNAEVATRRRTGQQVLAGSMKDIHGVTLQQRNLDRVAIVSVHDAGAFAEHFDRAGPRTTAPQYIGVENAQRRTAQVAGGDALDEARDIDVRGTGRGAGRVK